MKSLRPEGRYRVSFVDTGKSYEASGRRIMSDGFALTLDAYQAGPRSHCSEVILIHPIKGDVDISGKSGALTIEAFFVSSSADQRPKISPNKK